MTDEKTIFLPGYDMKIRNYEYINSENDIIRLQVVDERVNVNMVIHRLCEIVCDVTYNENIEAEENMTDLEELISNYPYFDNILTLVAQEDHDILEEFKKYVPSKLYLLAQKGIMKNNKFHARNNLIYNLPNFPIPLDVSELEGESQIDPIYKESLSQEEKNKVAYDFYGVVSGGLGFEDTTVQSFERINWIPLIKEEHSLEEYALRTYSAYMQARKIAENDEELEIEFIAEMTLDDFDSDVEN